MPLTSKNFGYLSLEDVGDFHWLLWRWSTVSYTKIHLQSKYRSIWKRSMMSWHICIRCSFWSSFSSLGTNDLQTLRVPKSSVIIFHCLFHIQPTYYYSNKQPIFDTYYLPYPPKINLSPASWGSPPQGVTPPLQNPCLTFCTTQKHVEWHIFISIHLLKYQMPVMEFLHPDQKFPVYSLLDVYRPFFNAHSRSKREVKTNTCEKSQWLLKDKMTC